MGKLPNPRNEEDQLWIVAYLTAMTATTLGSSIAGKLHSPDFLDKRAAELADLATKRIMEKVR